MKRARTIRRRQFIGLIGSAAAWPLAARAQQTTKIPRIGYLVGGTADSLSTRTSIDGFREGLRQLGHVEGRTIAIEFAEAHGRVEKFPELAADLVRRNIDLIIAPNTPAARAARQATATIPIVGAALGDPVGDGLASSLAKPGGNVTGLTFLGPELTAKRLQLLKDTLPSIARAAAIWHPDAFGERTTGEMLRTTEIAARSLGVQIDMRAVRALGEFDAAFAWIVQQRAEAVLVFPSPLLFSQQQRIAQLSLQHRLPSVFNDREFVQLGGFMAYGPNIAELARRSATHVDRILKGARPADLPIEQPTKFELSINLKTAKALGIAVPTGVQQLADEVIE